jgi:RNA ligase (TIGR02306 family)
MSTFTVLARHISLSPIENADRLELAHVDGTDYVAVVQKGLHQTGDLIVYIPEAAILPDQIINEMGLVAEDGKTMLAGGTLNADGTKKRDRVKALKLRGQLSQGLIFSHTERLGQLVEGQDYSEALGITKYLPPIPMEMAGTVEHETEMRTYTDIENIKNYPNILVAGEPVIASEKLHGSCTIFTRSTDGRLLVSSKGLAGKGLTLINETAEGQEPRNIYHRIAQRFDIARKLDQLAAHYPDQTLTIFGETLGVQDLMYGLQKGQLDFRAFDIRISDRYLDYQDFVDRCQQLDLAMVPVLYQGPFDRDALEAVASGRETLTGKESNIREGVVIRPLIERTNDEIGRVILKMISPKYLLRKGEDTTEFE